MSCQHVTFTFYAPLLCMPHFDPSSRIGFELRTSSMHGSRFEKPKGFYIEWQLNLPVPSSLIQFNEEMELQKYKKKYKTSDSNSEWLLRKEIIPAYPFPRVMMIINYAHFFWIKCIKRNYLDSLPSFPTELNTGVSHLQWTPDLTQQWTWKEMNRKTSSVCQLSFISLSLGQAQGSSVTNVGWG